MLNLVEENGRVRVGSGRIASVPLFECSAEAWALNNTFGGTPHE